MNQADNVFTFKHFAQLGQSVLIEPVLLEEGNLLFYPQSRQIIMKEECVSDIKFEAKKGLILSGKIEPATENVKIKIINNKTKEEVISILTNSEGKYKVGPLYDD